MTKCWLSIENRYFFIVKCFFIDTIFVDGIYMAVFPVVSGTSESWYCWRTR